MCFRTCSITRLDGSFSAVGLNDLLEYVSDVFCVCLSSETRTAGVNTCTFDYMESFLFIHVNVLII
jgi:hypothetical protein